MALSHLQMAEMRGQDLIVKESVIRAAPWGQVKTPILSRDNPRC